MEFQQSLLAHAYERAHTAFFSITAPLSIINVFFHHIPWRIHWKCFAFQKKNLLPKRQFNITALYYNRKQKEHPLMAITSNDFLNKHTAHSFSSKFIWKQLTPTKIQQGHSRGFPISTIIGGLTLIFFMLRFL